MVCDKYVQAELISSAFFRRVVKIPGTSPEALAESLAGEVARAPVIRFLEPRRPRRGIPDETEALEYCTIVNKKTAIEISRPEKLSEVTGELITPRVWRAPPKRPEPVFRWRLCSRPRQSFRFYRPNTPDGWRGSSPEYWVLRTL